MNGRPSYERYRDGVLTLLAVVLSVGALRACYPLAMPVCFAGILLAALWPLKLWFDRALPSWLSYVLAVLTLVVLMGGFIGAIYLSLGQVVAVLGRHWPDLQALFGRVQEWAEHQGIPLSEISDKQRVFATVSMIASKLYSFVTYTAFVGLLVIVGLVELSRWRKALQGWSDADTRRKTRDIFITISEQVRRYLSTTLATSVLTGVASSLWSFAVGLELGLVWGLLNFLLNFIPLIGNLLGIVPPTLYALVQFDGYGMPILVFAGFAALQIVISNFVYPYLQGQRLSLSPLTIILSMTFWTWLWGIAGALIAVPLTASVVIVCRHFNRSRWLAELLSSGVSSTDK
jgi:predicted PurR-regulated permease PerM